MGGSHREGKDEDGTASGGPGEGGICAGGRLLHSLYNGLVLPHLQYCLMVWGNFAMDRNKTRKDALLRLHKRFVCLMAGKRGQYHADPLFTMFGDLDRQQVRVHAWKFWNGKLLENQATMLGKVGAMHGHETRSARSGLVIVTTDQGSWVGGVLGAQ